MKKIKKILAVVLSALLVAAMFAGCSNGEEKEPENKKPKVAILQFMPHSSLDNCTEGIEKALDAAGVEYELQIGSSGSAVSDCQSYAERMAVSDFDLIIAVATPAAVSAYAAVKSASSNIPVVFCAVSDPVEAKIVQSLEAPGENCTGTADAIDINGQVALIKALQPDIKSLGVLYTTSEPNSISQIRTLQAACDAAGIKLVTQGITDATELASASATLIPKVDALTNLTDNNVVDNMGIFLPQAEQAKIPVYGSEIEQVKKGCLASASLDYVALGEQTGNMAVDILNGKNPATTPVLTVMDSFTVVNTDVAKQLGITIPDSLTTAQRVVTTPADAE
ncbi:MAG: ABC transporter substrate-binding protein [Eubacterium sp.]|nr:ABC transporter substrate-binding protein [Eubacterium sp.]